MPPNEAQTGKPTTFAGGPHQTKLVFEKLELGIPDDFEFPEDPKDLDESIHSYITLHPSANANAKLASLQGKKDPIWKEDYKTYKNKLKQRKQLISAYESAEPWKFDDETYKKYDNAQKTVKKLNIELIVLKQKLWPMGK